MKVTESQFETVRGPRSKLFDEVARIESALGGSNAVDIPDAKAIKGAFLRNGIALAIGLLGIVAAFAALRLTSISVHEQSALMVLLIGVACAGLGLVALLGLIGAWLENFAVARIVVLQSRLDATEANELAVAGVDGLSALREVRTWPNHEARAALTDEVVEFAYERCEGVAFGALRIHYVKIAHLARQAAPNEDAAQNLLRRLRPQGTNWPTAPSLAEQLLKAGSRG
jgi:hypothetical protein